MKPVLFEFSSYKFEPSKKKVVFSYKTIFEDKKSIDFSETIILPKEPNLTGVPNGLIDKILKSLHIIIGISYYKLYLPPEVKIYQDLTKNEANFWNNVYKKGLGEFFYRNKIDPKKSPKFQFNESIKPISYRIKKNNKCLAGIGGGKDSIVAIELLKSKNFDVSAFYSETGKTSTLIDKIVEKLELDSLTVQRQLDDKIFGDSYYNGHIPISAINAFLGLFLAVLYNYTYVIVANEYSSNFGNIKYKGEIINHQWSKSSEFEIFFREYLREFITPDILYFSLLRPFYEIRIVKMFSKMKKHFPIFSSCNSNFRINSKNTELWCCRCPKCVFVFILLSAFLPKKEMMKIFKKNLYKDEGLFPLFKDVLGFGNIKPFDCVGTFEESQAALYLAKNKFKNDVIMKELSPKIKNPKNLIEEVFKTNYAPAIPTQFKFLGMKSVLIFGYGKEGIETKRFLKNNFPELKIEIADEKFDKNYLKNQNNFDIAMKTPGISKNFVKIQYTTATNIFFSEIKGKNIIVGVTGSKGKSTTASLIFSILKEAGKDVVLIGNIGTPMLSALKKQFNAGRIFIIELSSYQLDDIEFSPDISVVTTLFPEHMNYHGSVKAYYQAKKNIINFQDKNNFFVYNQKDKQLVNWAKKCRAKSIPFASNIPIEKNKIPLLGSHNIENIKGVIATAKIFDIPDKIIAKAIKEFKPLPHRIELIGEFNGIKFYDDAISTAPESTILAIKSVPKISAIFLGGEDRGYDFSELERIIRKYKIINIVLFPESGKKIFKSRNGLNILETSDMGKAVEFAYKHCNEGTSCLLSTASPSYSIWKDFEEKGDIFKHFVKKFQKK